MTGKFKALPGAEICVQGVPAVFQPGPYRVFGV